MTFVYLQRHYAIAKNPICSSGKRIPQIGMYFHLLCSHPQSNGSCWLVTYINQIVTASQVKTKANFIHHLDHVFSHIQFMSFTLKILSLTHTYSIHEFHTQNSLSLSLSLSHTHTHTYTPVLQNVLNNVNFKIKVRMAISII